jgi:PiT family inorganic phosphate transporter
MRGRDGTSGADWSKATETGYALLFSPIVGFICAEGLLILMKFVIRKPELYTAPQGRSAPSSWIRGLLIITSAGVPFTHGSNDGQKGMGLIMLILIGVVPAAYALNPTPSAGDVPAFMRDSAAASKVVEAQGAGYAILGDPRPAVESYVTSKRIDEATYPSLAVLIRDIANRVQSYGSIAKISAAQVGNTRNDMYLASEAIRFLQKDNKNDLSKEEVAGLAPIRSVSTTRPNLFPTG